MLGNRTLQDTTPIIPMLIKTLSITSLIALFILPSVGCSSLIPFSNENELATEVQHQDKPKPIDATKPADTHLAQQQREMMTGKWYGVSDTKDGGTRYELVERYLDGSMRVRFRLVEADGRLTEQTEAAVWGMSGSVYFSITMGWLSYDEMVPADITQAYFYDAYYVIELTEETFRYRHVTTGNEYSLKKVAQDFEFPEIDPEDVP